ncbi:RNA-directed DNA polymerase, eukaryota, reverse transcriptase zinc-binding domain protein [Tanacetum coccineum]
MHHHRPATQQSNVQSHDQNNNRHGHDRQDGSDNHRNNNQDSGNNDKFLLNFSLQPLDSQQSRVFPESCTLLFMPNVVVETQESVVMLPEIASSAARLATSSKMARRTLRQSWNDIVNKILTRLSKWKLKTLSIEGRFTLLKSVLGLLPICHMSLFKVPKKVLHKMESIRCHFFNGVEQNGKKQVWVKWSKVLTSKENGGKLGKQVNNHHPSLWLDIVKEVYNLQNQCIDLMGLYALETNKNVSIASKLSQPNLAASFRRAPRGGLEDYQLSQLLLNMEGVSCTDVKDRWSWALTSCGDFSVAFIRKSMDGLPTRLKISKRGMDIQSILCPICDKEVESTSHIFFSCYLGGI